MMHRIGILGLDSSHPSAFAEILARMPSMTIAGVWDGGAVREPATLQTFARTHDATIVDSPSSMVDHVDGVMVLSVNWDTHVSLATPFLEADVPVLIDKPVAGDLDSLARLADVAGQTPLYGGSALGYHPTLLEWPTGVVERQLWMAGYNHSFYYGAHLTATARRLAGADWRSVSPTSQPGQTVQVTFENDVVTTIRFDGGDDPGVFGLLDVGDTTRTTLIEGSDGDERRSMYESYLAGFQATIEGSIDESARVLDGARLLLATRGALTYTERIEPTSPTLADIHADGEVFLESYQPYVAHSGSSPN